jgi:hypothetical protein
MVSDREGLTMCAMIILTIAGKGTDEDVSVAVQSVCGELPPSLVVKYYDQTVGVSDAVATGLQLQAEAKEGA